MPSHSSRKRHTVVIDWGILRLKEGPCAERKLDDKHAAEALGHYKAALGVMARRRQPVRAEIHSNMAVLQVRRGRS